MSDFAEKPPVFEKSTSFETIKTPARKIKIVYTPILIVKDFAVSRAQRFFSRINVY